jgi:hypothetical protein
MVRRAQRLRCAYGCAYRLVSRGGHSLLFVATSRRLICRHFPRTSACCGLFGRTFNPKVAGSSPARPIRFAGISSAEATVDAERRVRRDVRTSPPVALNLPFAICAMGFRVPCCENDLARREAAGTLVCLSPVVELVPKPSTRIRSCTGQGLAVRVTTASRLDVTASAVTLGATPRSTKVGCRTMTAPPHSRRRLLALLVAGG